MEKLSFHSSILLAKAYMRFAGVLNVAEAHPNDFHGLPVMSEIAQILPFMVAVFKFEVEKFKWFSFDLAFYVHKKGQSQYSV